MVDSYHYKTFFYAKKFCLPLKKCPQNQKYWQDLNYLLEQLQCYSFFEVTFS